MTKETQFTPGPWKYGVDELGAACVYVPQNDGVDAILYMEPKGGWEDYANSWLIAQCPSLYANEERNLNALKKLLAYYETIDLNRHSEDCRMVANGIMGDLRDLIETTEQLLAKCRGEGGQND
jgi:hypothetical protein